MKVANNETQKRKTDATEQYILVRSGMILMSVGDEMERTWKLKDMA